VRYGVLADVHGNLPALEAVLDALDGEDVDAYLCAGDLVGYGPFPNESVRRVADLGATCVAGNHDLIVLGRLPGDRCVQLARETLAWTQATLAEDARTFLAGLPLEAATDSVLLAHGSLRDPEEYTLRGKQAGEQLGRLAVERPGVRLLVLGHTHRPHLWNRRGERLMRVSEGAVKLDPSERFVLNPGAVGQSREPSVRARFAVLDLDGRTVDFRAVAYDVERCRRALERHGLPSRSYHLPPRRLAEMRWRLGALARQGRALVAGRPR
jgi:putative phosphoesterase